MKNTLRNIAHATLIIGFALTMVFPASASAALADPLINGGFETRGDSDTRAFDWQDFNNGYTRVAPTDGGRAGDWAIKVVGKNTSEFSGAFQRIDLNQTEQNPVFVGGWVRGSGIMGSGSGWQYGGSLYAEIHMQDGSVKYWNSIANLGTFGWRWIGFNTGNIPLIDGPIKHMFVVPVVGQSLGQAYFDDVVVAEYTPHQSAVTLMFDDGELSTYMEAKPVLDAYMFPGVSAVIGRQIGMDGFMNVTQLKDLLAYDWELVAHSMTHSDLTQLDIREARREMRQSKNRIQSRTGAVVNSFAFPFGAYNAELLAEADKYFDSARAYELGDNPQGVFPYDVKVRSVVDTTTPEEVAAWIQEAQEEGRWIVLTFHSIAETGDDAFHTAPDVFKKMIAVVQESGIDVITYDEGLKRFATDLRGSRDESPVGEETDDDEEDEESEDESEDNDEEMEDYYSPITEALEARRKEVLDRIAEFKASLLID